MDDQKNARLTWHSRVELVCRVLKAGQTPKVVATAFRCFPQYLAQVAARLKPGGVDSLHDPFLLAAQAASVGP